MVKKIIIMLFSTVLFIVGISSCAGNGALPGQVRNSGNQAAARPSDAAGPSDSPPNHLTTEKWIAPNNTVSVWFNEERPEDSGADGADPETMRIAKTADGKDNFALLRLPLEGAWFAEEVRGARLFLKVKENDAPASLRVAYAAAGWDMSLTPCAEARALVDDASFTTTEMKREKTAGSVST